MHKHSLLFSDRQSCIEAADWLLEEYGTDMEDWDFSYDGLSFTWYTAQALTERQKYVIQDTLSPISFLSEEL